MKLTISFRVIIGTFDEVEGIVPVVSASVVAAKLDFHKSNSSTSIQLFLLLLIINDELSFVPVTVGVTVIVLLIPGAIVAVLTISVIVVI